MILTAENYYSREANEAYMSCSQFKTFCHCEAAALAELRGEYERPVTDALLIGSYVDAHFEGTLDIFKAKHPELFTKSGELKAQYKRAEYMIRRAERDPMFMAYMSGEKQRIMTGRIMGVPFKIKMDSYVEDLAITDLKCMRDFKPVWNEEKQQKLHFILGWRYDIQGAIYQEIVRQNTGKKLPFYIAGITKEKEPDIKVYRIPDDDLDNALSEVRALLPRFEKVKNGTLKPQRCEDCDYCRFTRVLTEPLNFHEECEVYEVE